jgi:hypothetical protein
MNHKFFILAGIIIPELVLSESNEKKNSYFIDDGEFYARSRITIQKEMEYAKSEKLPIKYHIIDLINNPDLDRLRIMNHYVRIFVDEGNLAGVRGAFIEAYALASTPCRSDDLLASYGEPLRNLQKALGDMNFASSLKKMRPEVQSAVFYILYFTYWPLPGKDKDFDDQRELAEPSTYALSQKVARLKWPSDYETTSRAVNHDRTK